MPPSQRPRRSTSYDVARAAGVSQSTVSRCFQPGSSISSGTREHVLRVAAELGYTRNALARSLITRRSNMVGVIATKFTIRNNPDIVFILDDALKRHGMSLLLVVVETDASAGESLREAFEYPLDGVISCALLEDVDIERFVRRGVPIVSFNRQIRFAGVDCIGTDQVGGARALADTLFDAGHRDILCIGGPEGAPVSRVRVDAFVARLGELGVTRLRAVAGNFSYESGHDAFLESVGNGSRPDAVFCANDRLAMGVMDACRFTLGWQVPEDVSVVGFDGIPEAAHPTYDLTTVHQNLEPMAARAVDMLRLRMSEPDRPAEGILIAGDLVLRSSARLSKGS